MKVEYEFKNCLKRIGENIRRLRKEKHMSVEDLANLSYSNVHDFEQFEDGTREMGVFALIKIADGLNVKVEELLM